MVPSGMATAKATPVVTSVPASNAPIPYWGSEKSGVHMVSLTNRIKGTLAKKGADSVTKVTMMPKVTSTEAQPPIRKSQTISASTALSRRRVGATKAAEAIVESTAPACA